MVDRALAAAVGLALLLVTARGVLLLTGTADSSTARAVLQLLALAAAWLLVNSSVEGPVLWAASTRHGLTVADCCAAPALVVAALLALR